MLQRLRTMLRSTVQFRPSQLYLLEATFVGVFLIQALRFLISMIYSRLEGASVVAAQPPDQITQAMLDIANPTAVSVEVAFLAFALALPVITVLIGRFRLFLPLAAAITAVGRTLMLSETSITPTIAATIAVGGG